MQRIAAGEGTEGGGGGTNQINKKIPIQFRGNKKKKTQLKPAVYALGNLASGQSEQRSWQMQNMSECAQMCYLVVFDINQICL